MSALDVSPAPGSAKLGRQVTAQAAMELRLTLRNGEQLLLTVVIPTVLLILFASAPIATLPKPRIDFLMPGVLALAVMSTAFTGQAIATGFERRYGVLRRLGTTPLPRAALLAAKTAAVLAVEALQVALLCVVGVAYGWSPHGNPLPVIGLLLVGTAAFSALGLLMAGTFRAEATLAGANLVYLVFLVLGGVAFPLSDFSVGLRRVLELLPIAALSGGLRMTLAAGNTPALHDWLTLLGWALLAGAAAARWFRWD